MKDSIITKLDNVIRQMSQVEHDLRCYTEEPDQCDFDSLQSWVGAQVDSMRAIREEVAALFFRIQDLNKLIINQ